MLEKKKKESAKHSGAPFWWLIVIAICLWFFLFDEDCKLHYCDRVYEYVISISVTNEIVKKEKKTHTLSSKHD